MPKTVDSGGPLASLWVLDLSGDDGDAVTRLLADLPAKTGPTPFRHIPPAPQRPAPLPGQDTREICHKILGMSSEETERLINDGVLFASTDTA